MAAETITNRESWKERYRNGFFLAPMVRVGTLPMRLLCLEYGADLVWTPEIVDKSIIGSERIVNEKTGVISYIKNKKDIFTVHPSEKSKVVFQLGSAGPETALKAAQLVERDVSGFDLNCGCPVKFSVNNGMGAALMSDPDRLCSILEAMVKGVNVPVTCKIRVFPDEKDTMALVRRIAATGISALTVHCRTRDMRPREKAMWNRLVDIVKELQPELPVVLNGDIFDYSDIQRAKDATGAVSVMTARGAEANPSIFRPEGKLPATEIAAVYTKCAMRIGNSFSNTKYTLLKMYPDTKSKIYSTMQGSRSYKEICEALGLEDFYEAEGALYVQDMADFLASYRDQDIKNQKRQATSTGIVKDIEQHQQPVVKRVKA